MSSNENLFHDSISVLIRSHSHMAFYFQWIQIVFSYPMTCAYTTSNTEYYGALFMAFELKFSPKFYYIQHSMFNIYFILSIVSKFSVLQNMHDKLRHEYYIPLFNFGEFKAIFHTQ